VLDLVRLPVDRGLQLHAGRRQHLHALGAHLREWSPRSGSRALELSTVGKGVGTLNGRERRWNSRQSGKGVGTLNRSEKALELSTGRKRRWNSQRSEKALGLSTVGKRRWESRSHLLRSLQLRLEHRAGLDGADHLRRRVDRGQATAAARISSVHRDTCVHGHINPDSSWAQGRSHVPTCMTTRRASIQMKRRRGHAGRVLRATPRQQLTCY
jgi:hypothetical protein